MPVPPDEIARRIAAFQAALKAAGIEAAVIVQNADLYYLAGTVQQSHLLVPAEGEPVLFTRKTVARAREESPLTVAPLPSLRELGGLIAAHCGGMPAVVGLELDVLPVAAYRRYEDLLPSARFTDVGPLLVRRRAVKSAWEIERIAAAAGLVAAVWARIPEILREGMTEAAFAGRVEAEARALGHQGVIRMRAFNGEMFYGQLLTGVSGAVPSFLDTPLAGTGLSAAVAQGVSFKAIGRGEPVVFDFVPALDGYIADFTRMFVARRAAGRARARPRRRAAGAGGRGRLRPPRRHLPRALRGCARGRRRRRGWRAHFMGYGPAQVRFVGHGVGLELDELPVLSPNDLVLEEGMVFALEPKFVFPGVGAVGIENTWVVTAGGIERLTRAPEEIVVL